MVWLIWIVVALVALAGEALTTALILASFALAAVIVAPLSLVAPLAVQIPVFGALSLLLLGVARPAVLRLLPQGDTEESRPRIGPSGQLALAAERVDQRRGQIQVGNGEFWSARSLEPGMEIEQGQEVQIVRMEGLIARVRPVVPTLSVAPQESPDPSTQPAAVQPPARGAGYPFGLSAREVEVLGLMSLGLSNAEIADRLFLSPRTVHHHVSHIFDKMGAQNRVEAVRMAMERGLVSPGESAD